MRSRRDLLADLWRHAGTALGAAWGLLLFRALRTAAPPRREVTLDADAVARAASSGGAVVGPCFVAGTVETPSALSLECPHLGCRVAPAPDGGLRCPCHGSRFHTDGSVAAGPARAPLAPVELKRGKTGWVART